MKVTILVFLIAIIGGIYAHDHPMVGVISHPVNPEGQQAGTFVSYIQVETAKFIESSGARNVAIPFDQSWNESETVLQNLNGIFVQNSFDASISSDESFKETLKNAYDYTIAQNDNGTYFPLWASGILALQIAEIATGQQYNDNVNALDYATKLSISEPYQGDQNLYITHQIKHDFLRHAFDDKAVYFNQAVGITPETYSTDPILSKTFDIVSKATDKSGKTFISMLKAKRYPIILSFSLFESVYNFYPGTNVPHSSESTRLAVQFSKSFTNICRLNDRQFPDLKDEYVNNLFNHKLTTSIEKEYQTFWFEESD